MTDTQIQSPPIPLHLGPGESGSEFNSPQLLADPVSYFTEGYRAHGQIFRTRYRGSDWVTIAGIEANDFFWQNTADWSYHQAGAGFRDQFGPTYLTQLDGSPHLRKRRLLKPAFSAEAVGRYVPIMAGKTAEFMEGRDGWGDDANQWIPALLISLNQSTLLRTELSRPQKSDAITLEGELIYGVGVSANPAEFFSRPGYAERKARVFGWVRGLTEARLAGKREPDNFQAIIDQDPGSLEPLTHEELQNDAYMMLVAGIHNTANLLKRIIERISGDTAWVEELRTELHGYRSESFSRGIGQFPKLRATIMEGERLHPGGTFLKRRPLKDLPFCGKIIPAATPVLQAHTLSHFLAEYYDTPLEFRPRRWLENGPTTRKALSDFGGGAHICIGMNLTRIHVPIVLAELVSNYDWTLGYEPARRLTVDAGAGLLERHEPIVLVKR